MDKPSTASEMGIKERPILFTPAMAAAVYAGRKTQTRRVLKHDRGADRIIWTDKGELWPGRGEPYIGWVAQVDKLNGLHLPIACPYGVPGDRLYVRESVWQPKTYPTSDQNGEAVEGYWGSLFHYAANGNPPNTPNRHYPNGLQCGSFSAPDPYASWHRRPNIHMPRWACRSVLEVVSVRVERVRDIGKDGRKAHDVLAEGITREQIDHMQKFFHADDSPALAFRDLWNKVNGPEAWDRNDWVWVIEFRKLSETPKPAEEREA